MSYPQTDLSIPSHCKIMEINHNFLNLYKEAVLTFGKESRATLAWLYRILGRFLHATTHEWWLWPLYTARTEPTVVRFTWWVILAFCNLRSCKNWSDLENLTLLSIKNSNFQISNCQIKSAQHSLVMDLLLFIKGYHTVMHSDCIRDVGSVEYSW